MLTTPRARVRSLVVVKGGEIVYERYHPLDSVDQATPSWSVAKSFTSAIVGMLIGEGRLELDAPAPVEEWQAEGDPRREITLEDLLRMSSGLEWKEEYGPGSLLSQMFDAPHAAEIPISQELVDEPGTEWAYSTGTTAILAEIAADEFGGGDALDAYVHERLLDPLGMTSTVLDEDSTGTWLGGLGCRLDATATSPSSGCCSCVMGCGTASGSFRKDGSTSPARRARPTPRTGCSGGWTGQRGRSRRSGCGASGSSSHPSSTW